MNIVALIWFFLALAIFVLIYGIRYLKNKENMALIERNVDIDKKGKSATSLLISRVITISIALGFILGMISSSFVEPENFKIVTFLVSVLICGGGGLICSSYLANKRSDR